MIIAKGQVLDGQNDQYFYRFDVCGMDAKVSIL